MTDRRRTTSLTTLELHLLDAACGIVARAFPGTYLVGTAAAGDTWRDVDVRSILADDDFDRLFGGDDGRHRWELVCLTTAVYLCGQTGLPVDYQIQRQTEANARHPDGARTPLGRYRNYAGWGDATPFVPRE